MRYSKVRAGDVEHATKASHFQKDPFQEDLPSKKVPSRGRAGQS